MATQRQKAANQKNAQNSPGPATPEGKETASQNALKHGLLAAKTATLPWEDPAELEQLQAQMQQQWQPQGDLETALVGQMVAALFETARSRGERGLHLPLPEYPRTAGKGQGRRLRVHPS
jgi:hypothetical protein